MRKICVLDEPHSGTSYSAVGRDLRGNEATTDITQCDFKQKHT